MYCRTIHFGSEANMRNNGFLSSSVFVGGETNLVIEELDVKLGTISIDVMLFVLYLTVFRNTQLGDFL